MKISKKDEAAIAAHIRRRLAEKTAPAFKDISKNANRDAARLFPDPAKEKAGK